MPLTYHTFAFRCLTCLHRGLAITMADFEAAITRVQPSVRREGFTTTPDVTWADVGSLGEVCVAYQLVSQLMIALSVQKDGFTTTPDVTWADVGSLGEPRSFHR